MDILFLKPEAKLNNLQEIQFMNIFYDVYEVKFRNKISEDQNYIKKILHLAIELNMIPLKDRICAVDKKGELIGFILISRFKSMDMGNFLKFALKLFTFTRPVKAMSIIMVLLEFRRMNIRGKKTCIAGIPLIAVKKELRGKGIGTALIDAGVAHVKEIFPNENKKNRISLIVYKDNPAVRLYQRLGFEITEIFNTMEISKIIGHRFNTHLLMSKTL